MPEITPEEYLLIWESARRGALSTGYPDPEDIASQIVQSVLERGTLWDRSIGGWARTSGANLARKTFKRVYGQLSLTDFGPGQKEYSTGETELPDAAFTVTAGVLADLVETSAMVTAERHPQCPLCRAMDRKCPRPHDVQRVARGVISCIVDDGETDRCVDLSKELTLRQIAHAEGICSPLVLNKGKGEGARWFTPDGLGCHAAFALHRSVSEILQVERPVRQMVVGTVLGVRSRVCSSRGRSAWTPELDGAMSRWCDEHATSWPDSGARAA
jgi:hypothetical protein